jgi:hypothetical protein
MTEHEPSARVPGGLLRRFVWAITPALLTFVALGVAGCAVVVGATAWSDYRASQRADKARAIMVPGMPLEQAKTATAHLGKMLVPELHSGEPPKVVFWARGGMLGGDYRVVVYLDEQQRVARTEQPEYEPVD